MTIRLTSLVVILIVSMHMAGPLVSSVWAVPDGNSSYGSATVLTLGQLSVTDSLEGGINRPDTLLGVFATDQFTGNPLQVNDNGSRRGDGRASALYGRPLTGQTSINFLVTGAGDSLFFGDHNSAGVFDVYFEAFDASGNSLAFLESPGVELQPGIVVPFVLEVDPAWTGGTYDIYTNNSVVPGGPDPRDFYRFRGLPPGASFVASTSSPTLDTILGWYSDSTELLVDSNDDFNDNLTSRLTGIVPPSGEVVLAVTGYPDEDFSSEQPQTGDFTLNLEFPELNLDDADLNDDHVINSQDADLLISEISRARNHLLFDINGDLRVDAEDLTAWLDEALPGPAAYLPGDANLDGAVDVSDFNAWFSHHQIEDAGWSGGDFNADGIADQADAAVWNANRFRGTPLMSAPHVVPEPAIVMSALLGLLFTLSIARRS